MAKLETENFQKTLTQLKTYLAEPIVDDRDRAGIIQAFEFTFEQSWKTIQKIAGRIGSQVGNPKQAYTLAIQSGWIDRKEEPQWIRLLEDRNLTSHTYKEALAKEVLGRIQNHYVQMFDGLLKQLNSVK
jgi:nucleotidyltransferase substrate binding protein (TIGR01987 family)